MDFGAVVFGLLVQVVVFALNIVNQFAQLQHVVHQDSQALLEIRIQLTESLVFVHVHFVEFNLLQVFRFDLLAKGLESKSNILCAVLVGLPSHLVQWLLVSKDVTTLLLLWLLIAKNVASLLLLLIGSKQVSSLLLLVGKDVGSLLRLLLLLVGKNRGCLLLLIYSKDVCGWLLLVSSKRVVRSLLVWNKSK